MNDKQQTFLSSIIEFVKNYSFSGDCNEYLDKLINLHILEAEGKNEIAEELRNEMDQLWKKLTEQEVEYVREASGWLNSKTESFQSLFGKQSP